MPGVRRESEETGIMRWAPEKYIRDADDERGRVSMRLSAAVPVVDLGRILAGDGDEMEKMRRACAEWGMFHMTNHGISAELMGSVRRAGRDFFLRDDDAAQAERGRISAARRGDMQGYGQTYAVPNSKHLDWGDLLSLVMCPVSSRDYTAWPASPPELRRLVEKYHSEVMRVGRAVVAAIGRAARLPPEKMLRAFGLDGGDGDDGAAFVKMRMNMYPACEWADRVNGLSPHADMAGLTVLMQDETEVGLHVFKDSDGEWVGVKPVPGALVVMVGNMMELLSNGIFRSVVHRAVPNRRSHRLSVPFFFSPPLDSLLVPLLPEDEDENDDDDGGGSRGSARIPLFREFIHKEYVQFYVSRRAVEGKTSFYDFAALPHHPLHPSNAASAS